MVLQIAKPKPTPWPAVLLPAKDLMELQEYFLLVIVWDSVPAVRHRNGGGGRRRRMIMAHLDANRRILWRKFQGVVDDVADDLDHPVRVTDHGYRRAHRL